MTRLIRVLFLSAATSAILIAGVATPAQAADDALMLSTDGQHWVEDDLPLTLGPALWIPGTAPQSAVVYARNTTADSAELRVDAGHDNSLGGRFELTMQVDDGDVQTLPHSTDWLRVAAGSTAKVAITATLTDSGVNSIPMGERSAIDLAFTLRGDSPPENVAGPPPAIADTGLNLLGGLGVALGGAALGAVLVALSRRRKTRAEES